ncbi:MAG: alpha-L-fucosidase [Bacteroidales bacterium]|nr:alpha-L-fucosidase [Bacteroidales bacterium]
MKRLMTTILALALLTATHPISAQTYTPTPENLKARQEFADSKFGIFLHWGLYSMFAQGEWYMNRGIDSKEYAKAAQAFYPHLFDAEQWVSAIKASGARYICFTSRHHEGFSMWDTKQSDYNIMNTPYGRDVIRQLADECHRQGIKLHLYYSHIDWTREDYPAGRTGRTTKSLDNPDWRGYYDFMNAQLTELLTQYGEIGAIWFDGWWDHDSDSTAFDWELPYQYELVHRLQPACLVGNNHHQVPFEGEDIQIFERDVPGENKAGLSGQEISRLPLETCQTMNGMWGYKVADQNYKSTTELIRLLVQTSGKGANLLLNIGPQPDGTLPATALSRLSDIGQWLSANGDAIYGTTSGGYTDGENIVTTRKGDRLFIHIIGESVNSVDIPLEGKIKSVVTFADRTPLQYKHRNGRLTLDVTIPANTPDYIIEVTLK